MEKSDRPASVSVVSWIWITSGIFTVVSGVLGIELMSGLPERMPRTGLPQQVTAAVAVMTDLSPYLIWLTLVQMAASVFAVIAGVYYLKLRAWARGTLELLTWLSLAVLISLMFFWLPMWMMASGQFLPQDGSVDVERVKVVGAILGAAVVVVAAVPLAMMIRSLRSKAVREAIRHAAQTR